MQMIRKSNPNRAICGRAYLSKEEYRLLLNKDVEELRAYSLEELYKITSKYQKGIRRTAAQIVIDESMAAFQKQNRP